MEEHCRLMMINTRNYISHSLFVDDILIFGMLCCLSWSCIYNILKNFQKAIGLQINERKSTFYHGDCDKEIIEYLTKLYNIEARPIKEGMKYLGFHLKPSYYTKVDWQWISDRYFKRIVGWENKCLSMASRAVLTQSVLAQLAVYWANLFYIPASIIFLLNIMKTNFIWGGSKKKKKISSDKAFKHHSSKGSRRLGNHESSEIWDGFVA